MNYMKIKKSLPKRGFPVLSKRSVFQRETSPEEEQIQVSTICRNSTQTITEKKTNKKKTETKKTRTNK